MIGAHAPLLVLALSLATLIPLSAQADGDDLDLALPTENDALFHGGGAEFYQHIERNYQGTITKPWQGGQYGFVRNPVATPEGQIYTRFHEGIDIRPLHRDARGEPLDEVRAMAAGTVVYTNRVPGFSNYGNYVVVEHRWDGLFYYSLYGHLGSISARTGERVPRGGALGVLGYTGEGLNQERAHVHLELNLMLSRNYDSWHAKLFPADPNRHGIYNGVNLAGVNIARLFLELHQRPHLTIPEFLAEEEAFYRVRIPAEKALYLTNAYPWLLRAKSDANAQSYEVSFTAGGVPVKVAPQTTAVAEPQLTFVKPRNVDYSFLTRGQVGGRADGGALTDSGKHLMQLLTWPD